MPEPRPDFVGFSDRPNPSGFFNLFVIYLSDSFRKKFFVLSDIYNKIYMKIIITEQQSKRLKRILSEESEYDMEEIIYDIKTTDCEGSSLGNMSSMGVDEDEDGNIVVTIRYCEGDDETLEHLKMKARMEIASNYGLDNIEDDDQTSEYTSYGKPSKYDPQYSQDPRERYDHGGSQPGH